MARSSAARTEVARARGARLGFRVDTKTKHLVEKAARLERRNVTDFCVTALTQAAENAIERNLSLVLSEIDRVAFFDVLANSPKPNAKLRGALQAERKRLEP